MINNYHKIISSSKMALNLIFINNKKCTRMRTYEKGAKTNFTQFFTSFSFESILKNGQILRYKYCMINIV